MKEKYKVIVDMYECRDVEGEYAWRVEDTNGYADKTGLARTPLIAFAEAMEAFEELKNQ